MVFFLVFAVLYIAAGITSVLNNRPSTTDRGWSVGALLDRPPRQL